MKTPASFPRRLPDHRRLAALMLLPLALVLAAPLAALHAQLPKIFVSATGNDANDGSRGAPKRNFQAAHNAVAAGGQIVVLDTSGYGTLTITKSIGITVPPGVNGFITVSGGANAIFINAAADDVVSLRGLVIENIGAPVPGNSFGIIASTVAHLTIEDCTFRNLYVGIGANPDDANMNLYVQNCVMTDCTGAGLNLQLGANVNIRTVATGCRFEQNSFLSALAECNSFSGAIDLVLEDCLFNSNRTAISSSKAGSTIWVSNCTVVGNAFGVETSLNGKVYSRSNNTLEKNTNNNAFPGTYVVK